MVNTYQVAARTQSRINRALRGWQAGSPTDEIAFLNRLTEQLFSLASCTMGSPPTIARSRLWMLHRKGPKQIDKYGSDLAVTVSFPSIGRLKTAFFQLKKTVGQKVIIKKDQLQEAMVDPAIGMRSWVLSVNESTTNPVLESVQSLLGQCSTVKNQKTLHLASWTPSAAWLLDWLECRIGPVSPDEDGRYVEELLQRFAWPARAPLSDLQRDGAGNLEGALADLPSNWVPSRLWAEVEIRPPAA